MVAWQAPSAVQRLVVRLLPFAQLAAAHTVPTASRRQPPLPSQALLAGVVPAGAAGVRPAGGDVGAGALLAGQGAGAAGAAAGAGAAPALRAEPAGAVAGPRCTRPRWAACRSRRPCRRCRSRTGRRCHSWSGSGCRCIPDTGRSCAPPAGGSRHPCRRRPGSPGWRPRCSWRCCTRSRRRSAGSRPGRRSGRCARSWSGPRPRRSSRDPSRRGRPAGPARRPCPAGSGRARRDPRRTCRARRRRSRSRRRRRRSRCRTGRPSCSPGPRPSCRSCRRTQVAGARHWSLLAQLSTHRPFSQIDGRQDPLPPNTQVPSPSHRLAATNCSWFTQAGGRHTVLVPWRAQPPDPLQ